MYNFSTTNNSNIDIPAEIITMEEATDIFNKVLEDFIKLFNKGNEYTEKISNVNVKYSNWFFHKIYNYGLSYISPLSRSFNEYKKFNLVSEWEYRTDLFSIVTAAENIANANPLYTKKQMLKLYGYEKLLNEAIAAYPDFQIKYPQFKDINEMN